MNQALKTHTWKCIGCGCHDARACEGGCYWVSKNVCSRCVINGKIKVAPPPANKGSISPAFNRRRRKRYGGRKHLE